MVKEKYYCSFCGEDGADAKAVIASPIPTVFICDKCILLCVDILIDKKGMPDYRSTLRDQFAMVALTGMLARDCYYYADALMEERKK